MADIGIKKSEISAIGHLICILIFTLVIIFTALLQCSGITFLGVIPNIAFSLVCSIGFIMGERYGAIFGLCGGMLISILGSSGISSAPVLFTLCGYLCGVLPNVFFSRNFVSFLIYIPIMWAIHTIFTLVFYIMLSASYEIWGIIARKMIPELISCIICMVTAYGIVKLIYKLSKGKKKDLRVK